MRQNLAQCLGRQGEELAVKYLEGKGYQVLQRNYSTPFGEIDIITRFETPQEGERLVFVEMKLRRNRHLGYPEESITTQKLIHLIKSIHTYLQEHAQEDMD